MAIKRYRTMNGTIRGEATGTGSLSYLPDALGSVIATVDQTKAVVSTARYKPYGESLSSTGTQPGMGWNGTWGYNRGAGTKHAEEYVRRRFYNPRPGDGPPSIRCGRGGSRRTSTRSAVRPATSTRAASSPC